MGSPLDSIDSTSKNAIEAAKSLVGLLGVTKSAMTISPIPERSVLCPSRSASHMTQVSHMLMFG